MKLVLKLSGTLLLNQFIANIACCMCVIPFPFVFGEAFLTYVLFLALDVFFFYYISYHGAYKSGFHDVSRHSSSEYDRGYLGRGLLASLLGATPSILMLLVWGIGYIGDFVYLKSGLYVFSIWNLFGYWPLSHIIPNHMAINCALCLLMQIAFPFIGYVCGYKGIVFTQRIKDAFKQRSEHN
ncbi:MAG: hypothetical protein IJN42_02625 [Clostridia bacterium]|nr:hypothetical protein [Clostridia bacterium]